MVFAMRALDIKHYYICSKYEYNKLNPIGYLASFKTTVLLKLEVSHV